MSVENPCGKGSADGSNDAETKEFSCEWCDTGFTTKNSKHRHERNYHSSKLDYECPTCGDCFHSLAGRNTHHKRTHGESISGEETTCKYCGGTYRTSRSDLERSNFCSKDCLYSWRSECQTGTSHPLYERIYVDCANCGTELERYPYHKDKFDHMFCDRSCKGQWISNNNTGENHPNWVEDNNGVTYYGENWHTQRRKARKRDRYKCQVCGRDERDLGKIPSTHHIIKLRHYRENLAAPEWYERGNRLENLIVLCEEHHKEWEGIPLRPQTD